MKDSFDEWLKKKYNKNIEVTRDWVFVVPGKGEVVKFDNKFSPIFEMSQNQAIETCSKIKGNRDRILNSLSLIPTDISEFLKIETLDRHRKAYEVIANNIFELSDTSCDYYFKKDFDEIADDKDNLDFVIQKSEELSNIMIENIEYGKFSVEDTKNIVLLYHEIKIVAMNFLSFYQIDQIVTDDVYLGNWKR